MASFSVTFYGTKLDGKRQRLGRGTVDVPDAHAALAAAHQLIGKAKPEVRARINETRVAAADQGFAWSSVAEPKAKK